VADINTLLDSVLIGIMIWLESNHVRR